MMDTSLKEALDAGDNPIGVIVRIPAEPLIDASAFAGLDFVLLDAEHGPSDEIALARHIIQAQSLGIAALVRIGRDEHDLILRVLEMGAQGVVVPHVESAEEAEAVVASAHFPPLGDRGFAQYGRAGGLGSVPAAEQIERARRTTFVSVMVETQAGVEAAEEILAVDGVDAVMIGPADLSVSLGLTGGVDEPAVVEAVREVSDRVRRAGKHTVSVVGSHDAARAAVPGLIVYNAAKLIMQTFAEMATALDGDPR